MPGARWVWAFCGLVLTGIGAAGIVVPLLPATPFALAAAFCFARSSRRLHDWLMTHRWFGTLISNWHRDRSIDRRSKMIALATIVATPVVTFIIGAPSWAIGAQIAVLAAVSLWIWTRPEPGERTTGASE